MRRIKGLAAGLLLAALSALLALAAAELLLSFTPYRSLRANTANAVLNMSVADKDAGYDLAPSVKPYTTDFYGAAYETWSNELGCFDEPYKGGGRPVLLLGDSFTWGFAPYEDKYGTLLQKISGRRVLKCGVVGYGARQELAKARKVIKASGARPSLIVVGWWVDDMVNDYLFPNSTVINGYPVTKTYLEDPVSGKRVSVPDEDLKAAYDRLARGFGAFSLRGAKDWLRARSVIYNLLRELKLLRTIGFRLGLLVTDQADRPPLSVPPVFLPPAEYPWLEGAWKAHEANLLAFKKLAAENGSDLLFVLIPAREQVYPALRPEFKGADWDYPDRRVAEFLKSNGVACLDLLPYFRAAADPAPKRLLDPEKDLYWRFDPHWNVKANRIAAGLIALKLGWGDQAALRAALAADGVETGAEKRIK